jgi:hypothetical protein
MKKLLALLLSFLLLFGMLVSCSAVTIPNSEEAEQKMKGLGYSVIREIQYGQMVSTLNIKQVTILSADKGDTFIQVYYFTSEEDTDTYFKDHESSLSKNVEVVKKNKFSIYRGSESAVEDFLS